MARGRVWTLVAVAEGTATEGEKKIASWQGAVATKTVTVSSEIGTPGHTAVGCTAAAYLEPTVHAATAADDEPRSAAVSAVLRGPAADHRGKKEIRRVKDRRSNRLQNGK